MEKCPYCNGKGYVRYPVDQSYDITTTCSFCGGTGDRSKKPPSHTGKEIVRLTYVG